MDKELREELKENIMDELHIFPHEATEIVDYILSTSCLKLLVEKFEVDSNKLYRSFQYANTELGVPFKVILNEALNHLDMITVKENHGKTLFNKNKSN